MSTLRIRGIPKTIAKGHLSELYPGCTISLCRTCKTKSGVEGETQTATVTFGDGKAMKDTIKNPPYIAERVEVDDKFEGLTALHSDPKAEIDIIAVHGLGGHAFRSWSFWGNNEYGAMWLRDFLPAAIPHSRIITYGYDSNMFITDSVATIRTFGLQLLAIVDAIRTEKERPIIFVCHSLGGIVVKEALNKATTHNYQDILSATIGIVFFATPHLGSALGNGLLMGTIGALGGLNSRIVDDIKQNSERLAEIARDFTIHHSSISFTSLYETKKSPCWKLWGFTRSELVS